MDGTTDYATSVYRSQQELLKEKLGTLYNYAKEHGIRSDNIADLRWLIAIDIITRGFTETPSLIQHTQIAHMEGGNLNYQRRLDVINAIKTGELQIHKCDLDLYLKNQKRRGAGSSPSELIFGTIEALGSDTTTVVKMSSLPESTTGDHSMVMHNGDNVQNEELHGLVFEALLYKYIIDYMLQNQITPNVPAYYGYIVCKNQKYQNEPFDIDFGLLFMEQIVGTTLDDYLSTNVVDVGVWRSILFQILYTLHCFHLFHINHNDNHSENIFVEIMNNEDKVINDDLTYYTAKDTYYTVPIKSALIKIFDFDLSGMDCDGALSDPTLPANVKKQIQRFADELRVISMQETSCDNLKILNPTAIKYGINNKNTPLFDLYILFCILWEDFENKMPNEVQQFFRDIFGTALEYQNPIGGFPCRVPDLINDPAFHATGKPLFKTIPEIFEMNFFDEYRNNGVISNNLFHLPTLKASEIKSSIPRM